MEFVEGETLAGPMPLKGVAPVIHQLIETRMTSPPVVPLSPVWSGDGRRIAFGSTKAIYVRDSTGGGQEQQETRNGRSPPVRAPSNHGGALMGNSCSIWKQESA